MIPGCATTRANASCAAGDRKASSRVRHATSSRMFGEGYGQRHHIQQHPEHLGIAEIEFEKAGGGESDRNGDTHLGESAPRAAPRAPALAQKQRVQQDVRSEREDPALGPQLHDIVVKMRDPKTRRVVPAIKRIHLFYIRWA